MSTSPTGVAPATRPRPTTAAVLAFVNESRAQLGLGPLADLLAGERLNLWYCPVCLSVAAGGADLSTEFTGSTLRVWRKGPIRNGLALEVEAPAEVLAWCEEFDRGDHDRYALAPELARMARSHPVVAVGSGRVPGPTSGGPGIIAAGDQEAGMPTQVGQKAEGLAPALAALQEAHRETLRAEARREAAKRELAASRDALQEARTALWQAVREARAQGTAWGNIAAMLGVSPQRAQALANKPPDAARR